MPSITARPSTNRPPRREADLIKIFGTALPNFLGLSRAKVQIHNEVGAGRFISDIVALIPHKDAGPGGLQSLSSRESIVLSSLRRNGPLSEFAIGNLCGLDPSIIQAICRRFERAGMLRQFKGAWTISTPNKHSPQILAFEAKLKKWRSALQQARAYKSFADKSYVVLSHHYAGSAIKNVSEFRASGIGLLVVDGTTIKSYAAPTPNKKYGWRREYVLSRLI